MASSAADTAPRTSSRASHASDALMKIPDALCTPSQIEAKKRRREFESAEAQRWQDQAAEDERNGLPPIRAKSVTSVLDSDEEEAQETETETSKTKPKSTFAFLLVTHAIC